jgi:hypothetical protein
MVSHSTITLRSEIKERLSLLKGTMSWDDFLDDVADRYPADAVVAEMERRLAELRERRVEGVPWAKVKAEGKASRRDRKQGR